MDKKKKFDVYESEHNGLKNHYSRGVTRVFGENKLVFVNGHQILCSVQPMHDSKGLKLIGYLYA